MNLKNILLMTILYFQMIQDTYLLFSNPWKKLRSKATNMYKNTFGKDSTWHFLGHDQSAYPGTNSKYLEMNKKMWNEYYLCLKRQVESLGKYSSISPEAIIGFEGYNTKLECKICMSPKEQIIVDSIEWLWAPKDAKHFEPLEFTEYIMLSPEDKTLHLYNLQMENTGQYLCTLGQSLTAPYFLTVANISDNEMIEVHSTEAPAGPYPKTPEAIENYNLLLDTEWSDWSTCSECGKIGKRHKLGYCSIYSQDYREQLTPVVNNSMIEEKLESEDKVQKLDLEMFSIFKFGIPCNSHLLPKSIRTLPQVEARKNELMIGYCKIECPKAEVFEVRDKNGNVLETANNSAGIYSLLQSLPPLEPTIARKLIYGVKGKTIILACPGNMNSDAPIQWQIAEKNLIAELISQESNGRIFISITDKIHIKNAKIADSNIYSCWQQKELAGTIRLIVEKKFEMNFNHHMMLLGLVVVLSVFTYVFMKAFIGRKYAKV